MKPSWLIWQLTWRSTVWIVFISALVLSIYLASLGTVVLVINAATHSWVSDYEPLYLLRFLLLVTTVGGSVGAVVGLFVGSAAGLLMSAITLRYFMPHPDGPRYRQVTGYASALVGGLGTLGGAPLLTAYILDRPTTETPVALLLFSAIPALLVGLAVWRTSGQIAVWFAGIAKPDRTTPRRSRTEAAQIDQHR
jgi:hypothetical protein